MAWNPSQTTIIESNFLFFSLTEFYIKNSQRFPPKKKTFMSFSALILCLPHSKSLTLVFHILSLLHQDRFSKKLQQFCWWTKLLWIRTTNNLLADSKAQEGFGFNAVCERTTDLTQHLEKRGSKGKVWQRQTTFWFVS